MEAWFLGLIVFGVLVGLPLLVVILFHGGARTPIVPDPPDSAPKSLHGAEPPME